MMAGVEEVEVVVAHNERATLRVGDVFLKIDADQTRTDVEVEAMAIAPIPTPEVLWRKPPVLAVAAVAIFRRQLADIDTELAQGRLFPDEAAASRTEITRRMLASADREHDEVDWAAANQAEVSWRIVAAVGVAGVLPAAACSSMVHSIALCDVHCVPITSTSGTR